MEVKVTEVPISDTKWKFRSTYTNWGLYGGLITLCALLGLPLAYMMVAISGVSPVPFGAYASRAVIVSVGFAITISCVATALRAYNGLWTIISLLMMVGLGVGGARIMILIYAEYIEGIGYSNDGSIIAVISFLMAGIPEEIYKIVVYSIALIFSKNRTVFDALYLSAAAGATFGFFENCTPTSLFVSISQVFQRAFWAVMVHMSLPMIGCMFLVYMKCGILNDRWFWYPLILTIPATLHGVYDVIALSVSVSYLIWPFGLMIAVTPCIMFRYILKKEKSILQRTITATAVVV